MAALVLGGEPLYLPKLSVGGFGVVGVNEVGAGMCAVNKVFLSSSLSGTFVSLGGVGSDTVLSLEADRQSGIF